MTAHDQRDQAARNADFAFQGGRVPTARIRNNAEVQHRIIAVHGAIDFAPDFRFHHGRIRLITDIQRGDHTPCAAEAPDSLNDRFQCVVCRWIVADQDDDAPGANSPIRAFDRGLETFLHGFVHIAAALSTQTIDEALNLERAKSQGLILGHEIRAVLVTVGDDTEARDGHQRAYHRHNIAQAVFHFIDHPPHGAGGIHHEHHVEPGLAHAGDIGRELVRRAAERIADAHAEAGGAAPAAATRPAGGRRTQDADGWNIRAFDESRHIGRRHRDLHRITFVSRAASLRLQGKRNIRRRWRHGLWRDQDLRRLQFELFLEIERLIKVGRFFFGCH